MLFQPYSHQKPARFAGSGETKMHTAIIALLSAMSVAGVGTTAVAMSGNGMMGGNPMMGDGGMGSGMHSGDHQGMHNGMHGGMGHDCPCCDNDTNPGQNQLSFGP